MVDDGQLFLNNYCHPDDLFHVYHSKHSKNEPAYINEDIINHKFSKYELLKSLLRRLNGRYTKEELQYLTKALGHSPILHNEDQKDNIIGTTKMIRRYISDYKKNPEETPLVMDVHKYKDLLNDCDAIIVNGPSSVSETKEDDITVTTTEKTVDVNATEKIVTLDSAKNSALPTLVGGSLRKDGTLEGCPHLLDSGSSACVTSLSFISKLGYTIDDLKNKDMYSVKTAQGTSRALGSLILDVFLKSQKGDFYKFKVEFLCIEQNISKVILGYNFLVSQDFKWQNNKGSPTITLDCVSSGGTSVRRIFRPMNSRYCHKMYNIDNLGVQSLSPTSVRFFSENYIDVTNASFWSDHNNMFLMTDDNGIVDVNSVTYSLTSDPLNPSWPSKSAMYFETSLIFRKKHYHSRKTLGINILTLETDISNYTAELNNIEIPSSNMSCDPDNLSSISDMDEFLFDNIALHPDRDFDSKKMFYGDVLEDIKEDFGKPESKPQSPQKSENLKDKEYFEPNVEHLPVDWQDKYRKLFSDFKGSISQGKYHVGTSKLEPIQLNIPPGMSVFDPIRPLSDREYAIVSKYTDQLLESGIIEEAPPSSRWNSNVLLVSTHSESSKKHPSAIADKISRDEMLTKLEESSRVCMDFRAVNEKLPLMFATVVLPSLHSLIPHFCNRWVSTVDLSKAFFSFLLHPDSRDCTTFRVRDKCYRFTRPPQGYHSSPGIFVHQLNKILNERTFEQFKRKHPILKNIKFKDSFLKYIDDIAIISPKDHEIHFLLWKYLMEMFEEYGLLLNLHKSQILESKSTEYLGININFSSNSYSLTPDRAQAIRSWQFPRTKKACVSRIASLNYYRFCLPALKMLIPHLMILCRDDSVYEPNLIHVKEFKWIQYLATLNINFQIPDMSRVLFASTDSSHLSFAGNIFQYKLDSEIDSNKCEHHPPCKTSICTEKYRNKISSYVPPPPQSALTPEMNRKDPFNFPPKGTKYHFVLNGCVSKSYNKSSLLSPISLKELHAILHVLKWFEIWIRSCLYPTILFSDISFVQYLCRMKATSSKVYAVSVYLSSFKRLYCYYFKGSTINHFVDLLTRLDTDTLIGTDFGISKSVLEPDLYVDPGRLLLTPETLFKIMQDPAPEEFSNTPHRRRANNHELPSLEEIMHRWEHPLPEDQTLRLLWFGHKALTKDDYTYVTNGKLLNKTEYSNMEKKLKMGEIRNLLDKTIQHSYHISTFKDLEQLSRLFTSSLKTFMEENNFTKLEPTLYNRCLDYLKCVDGCQHDFCLILDTYFNSCLLNEGVRTNKILSNIIFLNKYKSSSIFLKCPDNQDIFIHSKSELRLETNVPYRVNLNMSFKSKYVIDILPLLPPSVLTYVSSSCQGTQTYFNTLFLLNEDKSTYTISTSSPLAKLVLPESDCCTDQVTLVENDHDSDSGPNVNTYIKDIFLLVMDKTYDNYSRLPVYHFEEDLENISNISVNNLTVSNSVLCNKLILLSSIINNSNVLDIKIISQLQKSDPELRKIMGLIDKKITNEFFYKDSLLMKRNNGSPLLAVDENTLYFITQSLHVSGYHLGNRVLFQHLGNSFWHPRLKTIITNSASACASCLTSTRSDRKKVIHAFPETNPMVLGLEISVDLLENAPRSKFKSKYVFLGIEKISTLTFACPCKSTSAEDMILATKKCFLFFNLPSVLRSDFSPGFASQEYNSYLASVNVLHSHENPRRSRSLGLVERHVALYREILTKLITTEDANARDNYDLFVEEAAMVLNNSIIYPGRNSLSRYALYHSPMRHQPPHLISSLPDKSPQELSRLQHQCLKTLDDIRKRNQSKYNPGPNDYEIDQVVMHVLPKESINSLDGGTAFRENSANFYKILDNKHPTSCRVINITTGDKRTLGLNEIRPISTHDIFSTIKKMPSDPGPFMKNIFVKGSRSLVEEIASRSIAKKTTPIRLLEDLDENEPETGTENVSEVISTDDPEEELHSSGYNLRKRKEKAINYMEKKIIFAENSEIVYFDKETAITDDSLLKTKEDIKTKSTQPRCAIELFLSYHQDMDLSRNEQILLQVNSLKEYYIYK